MERIRSLTAVRGLGLTAALAAVALGGLGCQSATKTRADMLKAVGLGKPAPVSQFMCVVEPTPQALPDITRNGTPTYALLGKAFLFGLDSKPTDADGQLTVVMTDATPRPPGTPPKNVEVTNFDPATMKKLLANDERLGRHYLFPIPWPSDWVDVTHVIVQAQYKPNPDSKLPTLYHPAIKMTVGAGPLQVIDQRTGQSVGTANPAAGGLGNGVPDPDHLRNQILASGKPGATPPAGSGATVPAGAMFPQAPAGLPPASQPLMPAGGVIPPTTTVGPDGRRITTSAWVGPPPTSTPPLMPATSPPTIQPPPGLGSQPLMPAVVPPTAPGGSSDPLVWPPPGGVPPQPAAGNVSGSATSGPRSY